MGRLLCVFLVLHFFFLFATSLCILTVSPTLSIFLVRGKDSSSCLLVYALPQIEPVFLLIWLSIPISFLLGANSVTEDHLGSEKGVENVGFDNRGGCVAYRRCCVLHFIRSPSSYYGPSLVLLGSESESIMFGRRRGGGKSSNRRRKERGGPDVHESVKFLWRLIKLHLLMCCDGLDWSGPSSTCPMASARDCTRGPNVEGESSRG